ncbi:hypothetical protein ANO11243_049850 [Dothideomycetidae sp. 11243]|nr:hypothetical protein ANO11243_049850 [fungal sp. No.11243]
MVANISRVESAVIDGRARTPRYIQRQLFALHDALSRSLPDIARSIASDGAVGTAEAWAEIAKTMEVVKLEYANVNPAQCIESEYSLARGKENAQRRLPYGCAFIIPARHTPFYSIIQPVCASIATGNCVVVEIAPSASAVARLLATIMAAVLETDTFAVVDQLPAIPSSLRGQVVVVDGSGKTARDIGRGAAIYLETPHSRTVAVVDRSSNVRAAAKDLVRSRMCFGGTSPYAPSLVLVNEFVLDDFCRAATESLTSLLHSTGSTQGGKPRRGGALDSSVQKAVDQQEAEMIVSTAAGSIVVLRSR